VAVSGDRLHQLAARYTAQEAGAFLPSKDPCFSFKSRVVLGTGHSRGLETGQEEG